MSRVILDDGPIPLASIERFDDPDVDAALDHEGIERDSVSFRLVEIALADLQDLDWLRRRPEGQAAYITESLRRGEALPPIVVAARRNRAFALLDGLNRAHAHWLLRRPTIVAYELIRE